MKFGDKDYALVPDRLKQFREENPRASIDTVPQRLEDGSMIFKATIVVDQSDPDSPRGTGNAMYSESEMKVKKAFEKLETISVGRALANVGYLNDGRVATTEEMEEFYDIKADKYREEIEKAKTVQELVELHNKMNAHARKEFQPMLSERRKELSNAKAV